jgi:hypothetical protein
VRDFSHCTTIQDFFIIIYWFEERSNKTDNEGSIHLYDNNIEFLVHSFMLQLLTDKTTGLKKIVIFTKDLIFSLWPTFSHLPH